MFLNVSMLCKNLLLSDYLWNERRRVIIVYGGYVAVCAITSRLRTHSFTSDPKGTTSALNGPRYLALCFASAGLSSGGWDREVPSSGVNRTPWPRGEERRRGGRARRAARKAAREGGKGGRKGDGRGAFGRGVKGAHSTCGVGRFTSLSKSRPSWSSGNGQDSDAEFCGSFRGWMTSKTSTSMYFNIGCGKVYFWRVNAPYCLIIRIRCIHAKEM